ncbi:MAG: hypothetical protein NTW19_15490, partial [Planctomycetota bacterium]|nr:hypothetical protein [Planctomycetota bacterium]
TCGQDGGDASAMHGIMHDPRRGRKRRLREFRGAEIPDSSDGSTHPTRSFALVTAPALLL